MRVVPHLLLPRVVLNRRFPAATLEAIEAAIGASEKRHRAEIRFAIEVALDVRALWRVRTVRDRALEVFAELGVWSTAERNGVLIYVLLAERQVEIVADHGLTGRVSDAEWREVCALIEREFAQGPLARRCPARHRSGHGAARARVPGQRAKPQRAAGSAGCPLVLGACWINWLAQAPRVGP